MPNIASVFKGEIARVARKEVRSELLSLKKAASAQRTEIAVLKRRVQALEQLLRRIGKSGTATRPPPVAEPAEQTLRFSAKGLTSQRRRLGLSAEQCGLLVGASGQSIYNWESGKARPRAQHLPALAGLKRLGKKAAAQRLALLVESH